MGFVLRDSSYLTSSGKFCLRNSNAREKLSSLFAVAEMGWRKLATTSMEGGEEVKLRRK